MEFFFFNTSGLRRRFWHGAQGSWQFSHGFLPWLQDFPTVDALARHLSQAMGSQSIGQGQHTLLLSSRKQVHPLHVFSNTGLCLKVGDPQVRQPQKAIPSKETYSLEAYVSQFASCRKLLRKMALERLEPPLQVESMYSSCHFGTDCCVHVLYVRLFLVGNCAILRA